MDVVESYNAYLSGDNDALVNVVQTYAAKLTGFLFGYVKDREIAEDLCEDSFLKLIEKRKRFRYEPQLRCYLYRIARSKAIDLLRRKKKILPLQENIVGGNAEEEYFIDDEKRRLYEKIEGLGEPTSTVVKLVYIEGMTYREAAAITGLSPKQVDNKLDYAKKKLFLALKEQRG